MLDALFSGIASFVLRIAKPAIQAAIKAVLTELNISRGSSSDARPHSQAARDIDEEISERERSAARSGRPLSPKEQEIIEELNLRKSEEFSKFEAAKKAKVAEELNEDPESFSTTALQPGREHQLQYHLGLVVLEKKCSKCGFPMKLQHKTVVEPSFGDFFWQCTRFYVSDGREKCSSIQFSARDLNLLHKSDIPELAIDKSDLTIISSEKSVQSDIVSRMSEHLNANDEDIVCPVHIVPMLLREKNNGQYGLLLDRYHLRCAHFQCTQTTKLKSFAQLAAYLKRKDGVGILH